MSFVRKFTKRDLAFALLLGLGDGLVIWWIFDFLQIPEFHAISWAGLVIVLPILWILGVLLGYFLGQWLKFFEQFGKFSVIGFTNTTVDFGVLNFFIALTDYVTGGGYALVKVFAFIAALICSYLLNKFWTFSGLGGGRGEFAKFAAVTLGSFGVNLGVSWAVATFISPVLGMTPDQWANIANAAGVIIGLVFNFIGFKFIVFKFEPVDVGL